MKHRFTRRIWMGPRLMGLTAVLVLLGFGLGCSGNNFSRSDTPVRLKLHIDTGSGHTIAEVSNVDDLCTDITDIIVESQSLGGPFGPSNFTDVDLTTILVWYENIGQRDEIGVTIPPPFTIFIESEVEADSSTTIVGVPFMTVANKTQPPLNGGGEIEFPVRLLVHIVVQGHMSGNSDERVEAELTMEVTVRSVGPGASDPEQCV